MKRAAILLLSLASLSACALTDPSAAQTSQKATVYGGGAAGTASIPLTVTNANGTSTPTAGTVYMPAK